MKAFILIIAWICIIFKMGVSSENMEDKFESPNVKRVFRLAFISYILQSETICSGFYISPTSSNMHESFVSSMDSQIQSKVTHTRLYNNFNNNENDIKSYFCKPHNFTENQDVENNMLSLWQKLSVDQDWSTFKDCDLVCLKSPLSASGFNTALGVKTSEDIYKAKDFFKTNSFSLMYPSETKMKFNLDELCLSPHFETEMHMPLLSSFKYSYMPNLVIKEINSSVDYEIFMKICSEISFIPNRNDFFCFMRPFQNFFTAYLALLDNQIVGTAQFYIDEYGCAGLKSICVIETHRGKGIGRALTEACLNGARKNGSKKAILTATEQGKKLYSHMGFRSIKVWVKRAVK